MTNNTKTRTRRKYMAELKAKVAKEAAKERKTLSELSKKYEVHPNLVTERKNQPKEQSASLFKEQKEGIDVDKDRLMAKVSKTFGSLAMEGRFQK